MDRMQPVLRIRAHKQFIYGLALALGLLAPAACQPAGDSATPTPVPEEAVTGAAVVAVPRAPVRPSPDPVADPVAWVEQGTVVKLVKKTGDGVWYQVEWPEGNAPAWILVELVMPATAETLTPPPTPTEITPPATLEPVASVTVTRTAAPMACVKVTDWPVYIIQPGDTLSSIGLRTGASVSQLVQANCLMSYAIVAGEWLYVPVLPPDPPTQTPTLALSPTFIPVPTPTDTPTPLPPDPGDDPTLTPTMKATETLVEKETPSVTPTLK